MNDSNIKGLLWSSLTESGFILGVCATVAQLAGFASFKLSLIFIVLLILLTITIFNIRIFIATKKERPFVEYTFGHQATFDFLTELVKKSKESIWVTRFSKGSISMEQEYFDWTKKRILGDGCNRLYEYRRITNTDTYDKAQLVCDLVQSLGKCKNFYLSETTLVYFTELFISDGEVAVIMFQQPDGYNTITSSVAFRNPRVVDKFKEIYLRIWNHHNSQLVKDQILTDVEINQILGKYGTMFH